MEAEGCQAALGGRCDVIASDGRRIESEVVGFEDDKIVPIAQDRSDDLDEVLAIRPCLISSQTLDPNRDLNCP